MVNFLRGSKDAILNQIYFFLVLACLWYYPCQARHQEKKSIQPLHRSKINKFPSDHSIKYIQILFQKQVPIKQTHYFSLAYPPDNIAKKSKQENRADSRYWQFQPNSISYQPYSLDFCSTVLPSNHTKNFQRLPSANLPTNFLVPLIRIISILPQYNFSNFTICKSNSSPLPSIILRQMDQDNSPMILEDISASSQPSTKRKLHQDLPNAPEHDLADPKIACYAEESCITEPTTITEISWESTLSLLEPMFQATAIFPPIQSLLAHCGNLLVSHDADEQLNFSRNLARVPDSLARIQFATWSGQKGLGELLTIHQLQTVGHFLLILKHEIILEQQMHLGKDLQLFLDILANNNLHTVVDTVFPQLRAHYDGFHAETVTSLESNLEQILHQLGATPDANNWTDRAPEALALLIDLILVDSPALANPPTVGSSTITGGSHSGTELPIKANRLRTTTELATIPDLQERTTLTPGDVKLARDLITYSRGIDYNLPPDAHLDSHITNVTNAERSTVWARYIVILGFTPSTTLNDTITELESLLREWDPIPSDDMKQTDAQPLLDSDWIKARFYDNGWAIPRDISSRDRLYGDHSNAGHILRLRKRSLFGTLHWTSTHSGNIRPIVGNVWSPTTKRRHVLFALSDPVNLQHLLQHQQFPILLVVRGTPINTDRNAMSAAYVFLLQQLLDKHLPGQCMILPTVLYHEVIWSNSRLWRGKDRQVIHHPQLNDWTKRCTKVGFGELHLTIIYCNVPVGITDGLTSSSFLAARTILNTALAQPIHGEPQTTQPLLFDLGGMAAEGLLSIEDCRQIPRRHHHLQKVSPVSISGLVAGMLAHEALTILAANEYNRAAIRTITTAIILPEVPTARPPLTWRLCCFGIADHTWLNTDSLNSKLREPGSLENVKVSAGPMDGLRDYFMLDALYEEFYRPRDKLLKTQA